VAAVQAVAALWGGEKGALAKLDKKAVPTLRSGLRLQSCGSGNCPSGYAWQVVHRANVLAGCSCRWRCEKVPSSGPVMYDPNRRDPILLPGPIDWPGGLGTTASENIVATRCSCISPPPDRAKGVIIPDQGGAPQFDPSVLGKLPGEGGPAGGKG